VILVGDCRELLAGLPERSVQTCVTSPPYFGLRDYGHDGQIGLEPTPDEFVAALVEVFREVRRVLRDDGTVWLNLGDSYFSTPTGNRGTKGALAGSGSPKYEATLDEYSKTKMRRPPIPAGHKAKDLIGVPWMVAFALRQPWYAGRIKNELDRVWLAAMIDAEGCVYIHRRPKGQDNGAGYARKADSFGSGLEVANTSLAVVERCQQITGRGSISRQDKDRRQPLYRWCLRTNECRDVLREVYPYLIAKQHEARIACGAPSSGERATAAWEALKILHGGGLTDVDFPAPASLHEPGWYLRMDNIWSKLNPMPESVTDRPTKSHEYVFLLSKGPRYFYDADAIREGAVSDHPSGNGYARPERESYKNPDGSARGQAAPWAGVGGQRNRRSVWTVATQPYAGAHFATFPAKLIEPCILAGTSPKACGVCGAPWRRVVEQVREGDHEAANRPKRTAGMDSGTSTLSLSGNGSKEWAERGGASRTVGWESSCAHNDDTGACVVLDPFAGSGTTGVVCGWHGRGFIGCELNPEYAAMAQARIALEGRPGGKPAHHRDGRKLP
jgi:DNA modification methylase